MLAGISDRMNPTGTDVQYGGHWYRTDIVQQPR